MEYIKNFIQKITPINKDSLEAVLNILTLKEFKKGTTLVNLGETTDKFYILKKGVVRSFILNENGKEHVRSLFTPIHILGSLGALIQQKKSDLIYECSTDCEIYFADFFLFKKMLQKFPDFSILYISVLENTFIRMEEKVYQLSVLNASQRYLLLKKNIPDIENLIPQYQIASYLNITPVQLSRIRKKISSK